MDDNDNMEKLENVRWKINERRQALYIPLLHSDQEIFRYMLEEITMPSVSFSDVKDFEMTINCTDYNSNVISDSFDEDMASLAYGEDSVVTEPDQIVVTQTVSEKTEVQACTSCSEAEKSLGVMEKSSDSLNMLPLYAYTENCHSVVYLPLDLEGKCSRHEALEANEPLEGSQNHLPSNVTFSDQNSDKQNLNFDDVLSTFGDFYSMNSLRDTLPKLKVTMPVHLHNEVSGAFMTYSELESTKSYWQLPSGRCSLQEDCPIGNESDHDASFCSADSNMTISSIESLPKVFYDPDIHSSLNMTAVSVPPRKCGFHPRTTDCENTKTAVISYRNSDSCKSEDKNSKNVRTVPHHLNDSVGISTASLPEQRTVTSTSLPASTESQFEKQIEPLPSKAMVKLVFQSPPKSSCVTGRLPKMVGNRQLSLFHGAHGKRPRNIRTPTDILLDSKRQCQRSTTPHIGNFNIDSSHNMKMSENDAKTGHLQSRLRHPRVPYNHSSSVPREYMLKYKSPK